MESSSSSTRRARLIWLVGAMLICASVTVSGCTVRHDPPVLPEDILCKLIPATAVAPMLPAGIYEYESPRGSDFFYYQDYHTLSGYCEIASDGVDGPFLRLRALQRQPNPDADDEGQCRDVMPDLYLTDTRNIVDSGGCVREHEAGQLTILWVFIEIGPVDPGKLFPPWTLLTVTIHSREGRDGYADATRVAQIILDAMDAAQAADKGGVLTVPDPTPTPQQPLPT